MCRRYRIPEETWRLQSKAHNQQERTFRRYGAHYEVFVVRGLLGSSCGGTTKRECKIDMMEFDMEHAAMSNL